jgi:mycothiol synthase
MTDVLAPGYTVRRPTAHDLPAVLDLLVAYDTAEFGEPDTTEQELREWWRELDPAMDAWVVVAPVGELAGFGMVSHRHHVRIDADGYVHPAHVGRGVGTTLIRRMEARAREHVPLAPAAARVVLNNGTNGRNPTARALLEREGYEPIRHFWKMAIDFDGPPPAPAWPDGIAVRPVATASDERAVYEAIDESFRDHWGYLPITFEEWAERVKGVAHDPSLWFLAVAGDQVAGAAVCRDRDEDGWVRSLGVRRPWRRRGLGLALLRHAFGEFYRRGRRTVELGVDAANETGATRLYERAGMRVVNQYAVYEKELRPGTEWRGEDEAGEDSGDG